MSLGEIAGMIVPVTTASGTNAKPLGLAVISTAEHAAQKTFAVFDVGNDS